MTQIVLINLYREGLGVDVTLKVENDDREIKAHRCILMGASEYFRGIFSADFQEKDSPVIVLKEMEFETLHMLVQFIYTGKLDFKTCQVKNAMAVADYLMMDCAITSIGDFVTKNLRQDNCIRFYDASEKFKAHTIAHLETFIQKNLDSIYGREEFSKLSYSQLFKIMKNVTEGGLDEEVAFNALNLWVLANPDDRYKHVSNLLSTLTIKRKLPLDYIMQVILPICKCKDSLNFVVALMAKCNNYDDEFVQGFFKSGGISNISEKYGCRHSSKCSTCGNVWCKN